MAEHVLKCDPAPFDAVWAGVKSHEIRLDDREGGFHVGDTLRLRKTSDDGVAYQVTGEQPIYTGQEMTAVIKHVQRGYGLLPRWVILSIVLTSRTSRNGPIGGRTESLLP